MSVPESPEPTSAAAAASQRPPPAWYQLPRRSKIAVGALVLAVLPLVSWGGCTLNLINVKDEGLVVWLGTCALAVTGAFIGIVNRIRLSKEDPEKLRGHGMSVWAAILGFLSPVTSLLLGFFTLGPQIGQMVGHLGHGRALRLRGKQQIPPLTVDSGWVDAAAVASFSDAAASGATPEALRSVALGWRRCGATEAASVAAFAHVGNELLALGAPASLVMGAHAAALDEVRHAQLCYSLAAALDKDTLGPAAFPAALALGAQHVDVVGFAAHNAVESCLLEGASARVAARVALNPRLPSSLRALLTAIASDEARHAAHGRAIVAWCAQVDPRSLAAAYAAIEAVDVAAFTPDGPADLEPWGLASPATWARALEDTRAALLSAFGGPFSGC